MKKLAAGIIAFIAVCAGAAVVLERKFLTTGTRKFESGVSAENVKWAKTTPHRELYMVARDGVCLHAAAFDNGTGNWVIAVHGYDSEWRGMMRYIQRFLDEGYSVLAPDMRGFGRSGSKDTSMGHYEKYDMLDWINRLNSDMNAKSIVLFGVSMGAATVMLTTGEKLPGNVLAAVEDCGYSSVREEFEYQMHRTVHLPPYPILWICDIITRYKTGWSLLADGDCKQAVKRSKIPILFIHGASDTFVPFYMQDILYRACSHPDKKLLVIGGAEHTEACVKDPELYWETVLDFCKVHRA